jgi:hypothetical protein
MFASVMSTPFFDVTAILPATLAFISDIVEWWSALDGAAQIFTGIGLAAGAVTIVLLVLTGFGIDHGGGEMDISGAADTDGGNIGDGSLISVRGVTAFLLGFGGGGSVVYQATGSIVPACVAGAIIGSVFLYLIYFIGKKLMRLQSDGTVRYDAAIGATGTVYLTIPPNRAAGGQAQVTFSHRFETLNVVSDAATPLPAGTPVRVKQCLAPDLFLVEQL